jgi:hypothetical protein
MQETVLPTVIELYYDGIKYFRLKNIVGCLHDIFKAYDAGQLQHKFLEMSFGSLPAM